MKARFLAVVPFAIWLGGCTEADHEPAAEPGRAAPVAVSAIAVTQVDWPSTYEATGTVRARTSATIAAKLMGAVREVKVQVGEHVAEGQVLAVLDSRDLETGLRRAEAAREEIRSAIPEADSGAAAAKANLDLAQATFNRMQDLYQKKSISNQEFDEASAKLKSAQAAHEMAHARRTQLDAKLQQTEQEVQSAQVSLSYAQITAPFAGVVTSKPVEPGVMAVPGAPLLTIEREGAYRLEASVEESRLPGIRVGQAVAVKLDALSLMGKVSEIVPEVDAATRAGTVKIDLPANAQIRSGVFGRALFGGGVRHVIAIPAAAVTERGQLQSVLVAENGVARTRLVTLGARQGDRAEVLSGLHEGDAVIAGAPASVGDGTRVEVRQ